MLDKANQVPFSWSPPARSITTAHEGTADLRVQPRRPSQPVELQDLPDEPSHDGSHGDARDFSATQRSRLPDAFSPERLAASVEDEVDQAMTRLADADADAPALRPEFLRRLDQRLADVDRALDRPGAEERLDAELAVAQNEMQALLAAVQPQSPSSAVPLTALQQLVLDHLRAALLPQGASQEEIDMLQRATLALARAGIDTPAQVDQLLARARRHDVKLSMLASAAGQLGFGIGFVLFTYLLAPALAPRLMGRGFLPAFGFGYCAGVIVGLGDTLGSSAAQNVATGMAHTGDPPATAGRIAGLGAVSAAATFLKNSVTRVVLPTLVMEAVAPAGMQRDRRNIMDLWVDCAGGPPAGALGAWLRATLLDSPQGHALRLLSTADLDALIENIQRPLATGDIGQALKLLVAGLGKAAVAPSTYAVVLALVAPMIGLLLAAQNAVPAGTMLLTQTVAGMGEQVIRRGTPSSAIPVGPDEHALRAGISTTLMSLMAGMATAAGNAAGPRIDAPAFRCYLAALRRAIGHLRTPAPRPEPSVRLRSISQV